MLVNSLMPLYRLNIDPDRVLPGIGDFGGVALQNIILPGFTFEPTSILISLDRLDRQSSAVPLACLPHLQ